MQPSQDEMLKVIEFVKELRNRGLSYYKIVEELESKGIKVSRATVMRWCNGSHNPFNRMNLVKLSPSPELSYIVGVFFGDGSVYLDNAGGGYKYKVRLKVVDREFAEEFKRSLESIGLKPSLRFERNKTRTDRWCVEAYSKSLYTFLKQPKEKLFEIAREYPKEFLRGFFDSEGSVGWCERHRVLFIDASNYDKDVLNFSRDMLESLGIHSKIYKTKRKGSIVQIRGQKFQYNSDLYSLRISRRADVAKFAKIVGFTIKRKMDTLVNALSTL